MRLRIAGLALLAVAGGTACTNDGFLFGNDGDVARTGTPGVNTAIVGSWRRTVVFTDDFGLVQSSETTWLFDASGTATRTVVARNLSTGAGDTIISRGKWVVDGSTLVITFTSPDPGETRLSFTLQGDTLFLATFPFTRVT
jgi:hypothetical protein